MLTARGWADAAEVDDSGQVDWAVLPHADRHRATVLRPRRQGALPLVLVRTAAEEAAGSTDLESSDSEILGLVIGIGDPAVPVSTTPDCGCDACDSGSRDLLENLDRTLLSIVDGSFEVAHTPQGQQHAHLLRCGERQRGRRPGRHPDPHRAALGRELDASPSESGDRSG